jgi:hypothetical protein
LKLEGIDVAKIYDLAPLNEVLAASKRRAIEAGGVK